MAYQLGLGDVVNIVVFFGLSFSGYVVFYFSQKISPEKQVTTAVFTLALGLTLIGLSHLFRIGAVATYYPFFALTALLGALFTFVGAILVFYEKSLQIVDLKKRHDEIKAVIGSLKDKYYKQEISEEDLRAVHSSLLKELTELEVKMKEA